MFEACLNEGSYEFEILDAYGDGILGDSGYTMRMNDEIVKEGGGSGGFQISEEHNFMMTIPSILHQCLITLNIFLPTVSRQCNVRKKIKDQSNVVLKGVKAFAVQVWFVVNIRLGDA